MFSEGLNYQLGKTTLVEFGLVNKKILKHFDIVSGCVICRF